MLGRSVLAVARLGLGLGLDLLGVSPGAHVPGHGEGLEILVGLGGDVGLKVSLELVGDLAVGHDLLEDLLLGSRPGDAALLLLLLLGSGRSLGRSLLGLGRRGSRSDRGRERVCREGDEVSAGGSDVGVRGSLVGLDDLLEVLLRLAGGEEGVLHLLGDGAGTRLLLLAVRLGVLGVALLSSGLRRRGREDRRSG